MGYSLHFGHQVKFFAFAFAFTKSLWHGRGVLVIMNRRDSTTKIRSLYARDLRYPKLSRIKTQVLFIVSQLRQPRSHIHLLQNTSRYGWKGDSEIHLFLCRGLTHASWTISFCKNQKNRKAFPQKNSQAVRFPDLFCKLHNPHSTTTSHFLAESRGGTGCMRNTSFSLQMLPFLCRGLTTHNGPAG